MAFHLQRRRKAPRAPLNRPVELLAGRRRLACRAIEVSSGGLSLWTRSTLPVDTVVTVSFSLPGTANTISAMARVVWSRSSAKKGGPVRLGLQFVALNREERGQIRSFVNRLAKNYRDLHILLSMNEWRLEQVQQLASRLHLDSYRDIQELKKKVAQAMDGFRA